MNKYFNNSRNLDLHFASYGEGSALILLHGFGLNHSIWHPVCELLSKDGRCIAPDLRGHGESDVTSGVYQMDQMAADVLGLMDRLEIDKAAIAGHSMGGYIALAFAQHYPDRLSGLGLVATNAHSDSPEKRENRVREMKAVRLHGSTVLAESLAPRLTKDPNLVVEIKAKIKDTHPMGIVGSGLGMAERTDRMHVLKSLQCPLLVIAGDADMITPLAAAEEMAQAAQNSKLIVIQGAGHMPMLEASVLVAEALQGLLS